MFMYLELFYNEEDRGVRVKVIETSTPLKRAVGSQSTRFTDAPFAIYAINGFDGLDNIDTEELLRILTDRLDAARIIELMGAQLPKEVLLSELEKRLRTSL